MNVSSTPSPVPTALNVPLSSLFPHYSHILLASGCTVPRLHPTLPPSANCFSALDVVHWYTSHPSRLHKDPPPLENAEHVTVIGHGNVALDVARMLLAPLAHLEKHDVPENVLGVLRRSKVKHVSIVGRRGPREASFTTKELREMMTLPNASMVPFDKQLMEEAMDEGEANGNGNGPLTRQQKRLLDLLKKGSKNVFGSGETEKTWSLEFFRSPSGVAPSASGRGLGLTLAHTALEPPTASSSGSMPNRKAIPTGHTSTLRTDLIYTSLGYTSAPTDAWFDPSLGHIRNTGGRVVDEEGRLVRGVYASGWAAVGAKGVLASTMLDAHTVVDTILSDLRTQDPRALPLTQPDSESSQVQTTPIQPVAFPSTASALDDVVHLLNPKADSESLPSEVLDGVMTGNVMDYASWKKVDAEEVRRGEASGKERERMEWEEARTFI